MTYEHSLYINRIDTFFVNYCVALSPFAEQSYFASYVLRAVVFYYIHACVHVESILADSCFSFLKNLSCHFWSFRVKPFHVSPFSHTLHPPEIAPRTHDQITPPARSPPLSVSFPPGIWNGANVRVPFTLSRCWVLCAPITFCSLEPVHIVYQFSFIFVSQLLRQSLAP